MSKLIDVRISREKELFYLLDLYFGITHDFYEIFHLCNLGLVTKCADPNAWFQR